MNKSFKTIDELIEIMKRRGVCVDDTTSQVLKAESYYAVVNGYKDPFLDKQRMQKSAEDIYKPATTFAEIYSLFCFDRDLRHVTFKAVIRAEAIMKSATVYAFCEAFQTEGAYLDRSSYVAPRDMLVAKGFRGNTASLRNKNLKNLLAILERKLSGSVVRPFISHYMNKHGHVPLWVLSNDLTMGNMAHFYQLLPRHVQNKACKIIGQVRNSDPSKDRINPIDLLKFYDVITPFRNICAHDERLYCASPGKSGHNDYSVLVRQMHKVLPHNDFKTYEGEITQLFSRYRDRFFIANPMSIFADMGFYTA